MTISLKTIMQGLSLEERQQVDDRMAALIDEDPHLQQQINALKQPDQLLKYRYSLLIQWSQADKVFLVHLPEFPEQHFVTHGDTYEQALKNGLEVLELLIDCYEQEGRELPLITDDRSLQTA